MTFGGFSRCFFEGGVAPGQNEAVVHFHCALFAVNFRQFAAGWKLLMWMELRNIFRQKGIDR